MSDAANVKSAPNLAGRSVKALATDLGISPGLVRLEIARGHLEVVRIGRRVIIRPDAIQRWLDSSTERRTTLGGVR